MTKLGASFGPEHKKKVLVHETAHLKPKRNPYNFYVNRYQDPKMAAREEARADYLARLGSEKAMLQGRGRMTSEGREYEREYRRVKTKMGQAGTKRWV